MLCEFESMWDQHLGRTDNANYRIQLFPTGAKPIHLARHGAGRSSRAFKNQDIQNMHFEEVIELALTGSATPVELPLRKNGALQFFIYYEKLNDVTKQDGYLISEMDKGIDFFDEAAVFSTLEANSGYWKIEIESEDRDEADFTSYHRPHRFLRMRIGL